MCHENVSELQSKSGMNLCPVRIHSKFSNSQLCVSRLKIQPTYFIFSVMTLSPLFKDPDKNFNFQYLGFLCPIFKNRANILIFHALILCSLFKDPTNIHNFHILTYCLYLKVQPTCFFPIFRLYVPERTYLIFKFLIPSPHV